MAKFIHDDVLNAALNYIKSNASKMYACSALPTTYNEATSTYALADVAVASGDFTLADGDASGRKVTVGAKSGVTVDTSGTITHIAIVDDTNSKLLLVTTVTSRAVLASDKIDIPAFDDEIADPS